MERGECSKGELNYFQRCVQKPCMQFFKYHMAYSVIILVGLRPPGICKIRFCGDLNWIDDDPFSINRNFHQSRKLSFPSSLPILFSFFSLSFFSGPPLNPLFPPPWHAFLYPSSYPFPHFLKNSGSNQQYINKYIISTYIFLSKTISWDCLEWAQRSVTQKIIVKRWDGRWE